MQEDAVDGGGQYGGGRGRIGDLLDREPVADALLEVRDESGELLAQLVAVGRSLVDAPGAVSADWPPRLRQGQEAVSRRARH